MDPRLPQQHPFSRGAPASYPHAPFQSSSNPPSYPSSTHPSNAPPLYPENQRRPVDNGYYPQPSPYPRDGAPIPPSGHSRHTSTSSIGHGTPINRNMPPPSSPQQQQQPLQHAQHQHSIAYPPATISRGPPPSLGAPSTFPVSRDLPSLSSVHRPGSVNSSMSISSMLGGPPPESREQTQPASQYAPPPMMSSAPPPSSYPAPTHVSPRTSAPGPDYGRFRRPRTPDHRIHESQGLRDRANSAGSPPGRASLSTPEGHRYSTPQAYPQRSIPHQHTSSLEERRENYPVRVPNPNSTFPPRPSSQPTVYNGQPPRLTDTTRRVIDPEPAYGRLIGYGEREEAHAYSESRRREEEELAIHRHRERERLERERMERDQIERERLEREREQLERERLERSHFQSQGGPSGHSGPPYGRQYAQQQSGPYNDPRDPWLMRARQEQQPPEQPPPTYAQAPATVAYDHPRSAAQSYNGPPGYSSGDPRYPPSYGQGPPQQRAAAPPQYESAVDDRQRVNASEQSQQQAYQGPTPPQAGPFRLHESPRARLNEETQQAQQRSYLGVQQEINRRGRSSPFPQAVQGAQSQQSGPGGEPGIKSEFGKMFSGIGSGVGSMATPGATSSGAQTPFSNSGQLRREDLDGLMPQDPLGENGGHKMARASSRGGRRRKLKEEDSKGDDDSSTGRVTPSGRGPKRLKNTHHQIGVPHRHMNHRQDSGDQASSPSQPYSAPLNSAASAQVLSSPPSTENKISVPHHHHINRHHHHHHHVGTHHRSTPAPAPVIIPKPKQIIRSKAVLDSVANLPRHHVGHAVYQSKLKAGDPPSLEHSMNLRRGFASTPEPLPRFEGQENSTFTIRIPRINLTLLSREEITSRRAVWGTDVYSDDSDIIAACIHSGWIRGEWPQGVDVELLGLEVDVPENEKNGVSEANAIEKARANGRSKTKDILLTERPPKGPMFPPAEYDLHVTVLILPALEEYSSTIRWGIKSRKWASTHDGLSFMIMSIRWVRGVDTTNEASGKGRRMRMKLALADEELDEEASWGSFLENGNGHVLPEEREAGLSSESYVRRDGRGPLAEISGVGMKSWWKVRGGRKARDGEKENELDEGEREGETKMEKEKEGERERNRETEVEKENENEKEQEQEKEKNQPEKGDEEMKDQEMQEAEDPGENKDEEMEIEEKQTETEAKEPEPEPEPEPEKVAEPEAEIETQEDGEVKTEIETQFDAQKLNENEGTQQQQQPQSQTEAT